MSLEPGTMLGPYEVRELIGKGGMGEVYRGYDTKLKRDVALKSLPEQFARDPDRVARFRREAQLLASLNHTNIAAIYGLEESGETPCLVMEYVPGETLSDAIRESGLGTGGSGGLLVEEALRIGAQVAEALEHAHEKAVIHRDLKPANVKLTPQGQVKVLDFGLAKAFAGDSAEVSESQAPTVLTASPTMPGTILGTAAYMSPEQAKGKAVDKRTDIWAFGCVLYELLTGKQAFGGEDVSETLASVLKGEPDWTALPEGTPHGIRVLLRRCLQKDAKRRFRDAADIHIQIEEAQTAPSAGGTVAASVSAPSASKRLLPWVLAASTTVVAIVLAILYFRPIQTTDSNAIRFSISPPEDAALLGQYLAASPDGTRVAFVAVGPAGRNVLWVRALDSPEAQPLAGTEGASREPFWSPDSRSIGFVAEGRLKRIAAAGGPVQTLADTAVFRGAAWNRDGVILFAPTSFDGLYSISDAGGVPARVTTLDTARGERGHRFPQFLSDGRHFLYFVQGAPRENTGSYVGSLDSKETKRILGTNQMARYSPPGYLPFMQGDSLMAQPFDAERLELTGEPALVAERLWVNNTTGNAGFSVSERGVLAYWSGGTVGTTTMVWFDRDGKQVGTVGSTAENAGPRLSPDGRQVAVERDDDIWLLDVARGVTTRFTFDPSIDRFPLWSPDGSRIVFHSDRKTGLYNFYQTSSSGAGNEELLFQSGESKYPRDWSSDGRYLIYSAIPTQEGASADLWVLPLSGESKPFPFLGTEFQETQAQFSPNGRWMAYTSNESGRDDVYIQNFPAPGSKRLVSTNGGVQPRWRRDGKELFFLSSDGKLMTVAVSGEATLEVGTPEILFNVPFTPSGSGTASALTQYDVTADGDRFLLSVPPETSTVPNHGRPQLDRRLEEVGFSRQRNLLTVAAPMLRNGLRQCGRNSSRHSFWPR